MASTLAPYSLPQSVFMLSLGSNALFDKKAPQAALQAELEAFLGTAATPGPFFNILNTPSAAYPCLALTANATQGDWCCAWGPVVYQAKHNPGATNAMYVAHSPSLQVYVVAIAGTNPTGQKAIFVEDLDVRPDHMKTWPPTVQKDGTLHWDKPFIAHATDTLVDAGTADGLGVLYAMSDPRNSKYPTLAAFLNSLPQTHQTLVFTGHSLGGALSPTLAMLLYPQASASVDPSDASKPNLGSKWANVYILATAGPTPGTAAFAARYSNAPAPVLPSGTQPVPVSNPPVGVPVNCQGHYAPVTSGVISSNATWMFPYWNMNYANVYDVVPRAWNALANLVAAPVQPPTSPSVVKLDYPSFFAAGSPLAPSTGVKDIDPAGPDTFASINLCMGKSGYDGGTTTPWYAPCLQHYPFNGSWGTWQQALAGEVSVYPTQWTPSNPQPPLSAVDTMEQLMKWVLNAHLGQYAQAFLGYPCPTIGEAPG